ncbi:PREDICTED: uncharacterized protein LOC108367238 [Rhagoletis zephyria]|uniref:uncharacterized protein LOC108367238 n=1 Tax=Rhagoletis zephyria TaxID=28612 RepID=UPI00081150D5|nr:PREDICTED: uncharacterized protein LOC108367238 [Rhagoletis zephyria]XP_036342150.1 uncharacterized protein LOC118751431 [Rhagoletis pomonella]
MDTWIKNAILSENRDAIGDCFKILRWLDTEYSGTLLYKDVETILICAEYVDSYFETSGAELTQELMEKYGHHRAFLKEYCAKLDEIAFSLRTASRILATAEGYKHVFTIETILKLFMSDISLLYSNKLCTKNQNMDTPRSKMQLLVKRIFQLPPKNIDIAIERLLYNIDFSAIGYIFLEDSNNLYISKYKVLEHKICKKIADGSIDPYFIKSMAVTALNSIKGTTFLKLCFENKMFANSLVTFIISYFHDFEKGNHFMPPNNQHKLSDILFLVHCISTSKSLLRFKLFKTIFKSKSVSRMVNKNFFVYY